MGNFRTWCLLILFGAAGWTAAAPTLRPLDISNESAPVFTVFTEQDGLSDEVWNSIGADADGFVWAGSASSLARFDGYRWRPWATPRARSLVNDLVLADGQFWAVFQREGLFRYDGNDWQAVPQDLGALLQFHRSSRADGGEDAWIGHASGIWHRVGDRWQQDPGNTTVVLEDPFGIARTETLLGGRPRQWLATRNGVWFRNVRGDTPDGPWQRLDDPRFTNVACTDVVRSVDHGVEELWVTTYGSGVLRIRDDGVRVWRAATGELPSEAIYSAVFTLEADGTRVMWLSSRAGLLRIRGDRVTVFDRRHGLPSDAVRALLVQRAVDGTDLLWIATEGGIARTALGSKQWRTVSLMGARENGIFSVMVEPDDVGGERLWVGTAKEGLGVLQDGKWRYFRLSEGTLPAEGVRQVWRLPGPDGKPWRLISLMDGGLWRVHDDFSFERIVVPWDLPSADNTMFALARKSAGQNELWFATFRNGVYRWRDGQWTAFLADGAGRPWSVLRLAEQVDADGRSWLWAAGNQGLARFDGERWQSLNALKNLPADAYRSVNVHDEAKRNVLWAGSHRFGVVRIDVGDPMKPRVLAADDLPSPPDPFVYTTLQDRAGRVYVCTNNGVQQLTPDRNSHFAARTFRRHDGLVHDECNTNAQFIDAQDRYWVGTLAGLSVYDPGIDLDAGIAASPPRLHITALQADGRAQSLVSGLHLAAGMRELRIDYGLVAAHRELESTFRSQLVGYDPEASVWSAEHSRSFTRLPPGSYRFEVAGRDYAGRASELQKLEFVVDAYWWQRTWVRIGLVFAAAMLVFMAARAYVRGLRGRQRLLEQQVTARTSELNDANRRLTELSYLDALTGIANRRRLMQVLESAMARSQARSMPLGVIVIDVDHFKDYNDRFGHLSGDTALRAVAQALASATRDHDLVARHGGEEFACVMVDAEIDVVLAVAERMRVLVESLPPRALGNDQQTLTISAGVVFRVPNVDEQPADLLRDADTALYRAKHEGRNRVCTA